MDGLYITIIIINDNDKCIVQEPSLINDLARAKPELKLK